MWWLERAKGELETQNLMAWYFLKVKLKIFRSKAIMPSHIASTYFQIFEVTVAILAENTNSVL